MNLLIKNPKTKNIIAEVSRYILATLFLFSGFVKAVDPLGTALKVEDYFVAFRWGDFRSVAFSIAVGLIVVEFLLGVLILMGVFKKVSRWGTLFFMGGMTLLTLYIMIANPVSDCGCFGDAFKISNQVTFVKNLFFLLPTVALFLFGDNITPVFENRILQLSLFCLGGIGVLFFIYENSIHLPLIDFRPYKVGCSLSELVLRPKDAPKDRYSYQFIYEKEGAQKVFDENNLPDSSWHYVDTKITLLEKGYRPPIEDFTILNEQWEEVTKDLLENKEYNMIWILAPHWSEVDKSSATIINDLYSFAKDNGILFYALSGSDEQTVARWKKETKALYPTLMLDAITLKTIARANPSVLFLKEGIIQAKKNLKDLHQDTYSQQVEAIFKSEKPIAEPILPRMLPLSLWFIITLLGILVPREPLSNKIFIQPNL